MNPLYSIIIPAHNEELLLPRILDSIEVARTQYRGDSDSIEVIVADNVSTDTTAALAQARGYKVATVKKRMIGAVRNGGAAIAEGQILCFCDADSIVHPETFNIIEDLMNSGKIIGGATGWVMERNSMGIRASMWLGSLLMWIAQMNPGVIFCSADTFKAINGYDENMHCAEDEKFFRAFRKHGRKQGLKIVRWTEAPTTLSCRKMDKHGDWHMFWAPFTGLFKHRSLKKLIREYWYDDAR